MKVKLPTLRAMQLGPYQQSPHCGCLIFHVDRIRSQATKWRPLYHCVLQLDTDGLRCSWTDNTLPNRRAAMSILHKALRQCGYRIARDKKTAVLK